MYEDGEDRRDRAYDKQTQRRKSRTERVEWEEEIEWKKSDLFDVRDRARQL